MHPHANPLMTRVNRITMQNGMALARVLSRHKDIRQVIAGHVHYTSTAIRQGILFTSLSGGNYSVQRMFLPEDPLPYRAGPAQMAVVLAGRGGATVHFNDDIIGNVQISSR